jgi:hypothetical protein
MVGMGTVAQTRVHGEGEGVDIPATVLRRGPAAICARFSGGR